MTKAWRFIGWMMGGVLWLYTIIHFIHGSFAYQGYDDYFLEVGFVREWLKTGTFTSQYVYLYPPLYYLLSIPLARLSNPVGAQVMVWLNQFLLIVSFILLGKAMAPRPRRRLWLWVLLPLALNFRPLLYLLSMAKIELIQITLLVGALVAWQRKRLELTGGLTAFAGMMKPLPLLLLLYLLWKREWRAVKGWIVVAAAIVAISSAAFGPAAVWTYFYNVALPRGVNTSALYWYENQSLFGSAARIFHRVQPQQFFVLPAEVTTGQIIFGWVLRVALLAWLAILIRPQRNVSPRRITAEWSMAITGMLLLSPFSRDYYAVFLTPAYVLLAHHLATSKGSWRLLSGIVGTASYLFVGQGFPLSIIHHLPQVIPGVENFQAYLHYGIPTLGYLLLVGAWALALHAESVSEIEQVSTACIGADKEESLPLR